ncbi:hypothetical protein [Brucella melitensis]|uniref:hypothetical protein n=1 Tax=Brucella melitensis TaxID=29459 RepID=UPI0030EF5A58
MSTIAGMNAHQDFQKRGFARAIAAAQRMYRAGTQLQPPIPQGSNTTKGLPEPSTSSRNSNVSPPLAAGRDAADFNSQAVVLTKFGK